MGTTEQSVLGDLQNLNSLISRDGGKIPQEIVQTISRFKVVEESLHRHAGSSEYRRSSENVRR